MERGMERQKEKVKARRKGRGKETYHFKNRIGGVGERFILFSLILYKASAD